MNKNIIGSMAVAVATVIMTGCVDTDIDKFSFEKPQSIAQWEYLNDYGPLKDYVDRASNPDFKLGLALAANEFINGGVPYRIACSSFNEVTAGNAMKYASCVADDGTMDFSTVKSFVESAKNAGITIYGHTLAWHSQQNNKYLNSLIADKEIPVDPDAKQEVVDKIVDYSDYTEFPFYVMGFKPEIKDGCLVSSNPSGEWIQYFMADNISTVKGGDYIVTAKIKGSAEGSLLVQMGNWGSMVENVKLPFSTEWKEVSVTMPSIPTENTFVVFQPGTFKGDIQVEWLKISHSEAPSITVDVPVVSYDFADGNPLGGWPDALKRSVVDGVCVVNNPEKKNSWECQLCHEAETPFVNGQTYKLKMKIKGSVNGSFTGAFQNPDGYKGCGDFPEIKVTTDWTDVTVKATCNGDGATRLLLNVGNYVGTLYFDDIELSYEKKSNSIELTPAEKKEVLTNAMDTWIKGMMEATGGYVTSWDVVNEALSGADKDGDGFYDLQSATRGTVSAEDAQNNFYWQDYLGDIDYVRTAVAKARQYFSENGGDESKLKLFINDYNLESDWDDNKKLKSLINWIKLWEADGVTKIDGIGSQMHVSCYADETTQQNKKDHIVKMLELLASSGKLVKISELDMGYVDELGNSVKTQDMTLTQHEEMGELYKFIVGKYFEIIPAAQRYGITQWCATDSPAGSGWRADSPVGLWDINYTRKPAYGGFADGLAGGK